MSEDLLPTTIFVDNGDNVDDVIYGNERKSCYIVGGDIHAIKRDPETGKNFITKIYKITKVDFVKNESDIECIEVRVIRTQ